MTREEKNYFTTLLTEEPDFRDEAACKAYEAKIQREWIEYRNAQFILISQMIKQMDEAFAKADAEIAEMKKRRQKEFYDENQEVQFYDNR